MFSTIVLIPGLMSDGWIWSGQIPLLSRHGPVLVASNDSAGSLTEMAHAILGRCSGRLAVAGHSMGGRVALEMARVAGERIDRLALVDSGAGPPGDGEAAARLALVDLARREGMAAVTDAWLPPMLGPALERGGEIWNGLAAMIGRSTPAILARQQQALIDRRDAHDVIAALTVPIAFIAGAHDVMGLPGQQRRMAAPARRPLVAIIEHAGHMAPVEAPEAVAAALVDWIMA